MTDKPKVTQADRERAAEIFGAYESMAMRKKCLEGKLDVHPTTEAFARHRTSAEQSRDDVIEECVNWDDLEDEIESAISDSFDVDWTALDGARHVIGLLKLNYSLRNLKGKKS